MCLVFANYVAQTIDGYIAKIHHHKTTEAQLLLGDIQIDNLYANIMDFAEETAFTTHEGQKYVPRNQNYQTSHTHKRQRVYYRKSDEEQEEEVEEVVEEEVEEEVGEEEQVDQVEEFYDFTLADKIEAMFESQTPSNTTLFSELFGISEDETPMKTSSVTAKTSPKNVITVFGSSSEEDSSDDDDSDEDDDGEVHDSNNTGLEDKDANDKSSG